MTETPPPTPPPHDPPPDPWGQPPTPPPYQPQYPPPYGYQPQYAYPPLSPVPGATRFDPADPLISNDYNSWWHRGTTVIKAGWKPLALLQTIAAAPLVLVTIASQVPAQPGAPGLIHPDTFDGFDNDPNAALVIGVIAGVAVALLLALLWYALCAMATARLVVTVATGGQPRIGEALSSVLTRVPALAGWYLLAGPLFLVALVACFLPVFYVIAVLTILPAVVLFERGTGIGRCFQLFHGDFGAAAGRTATILGLNFGAAMAFSPVSALFGALVHAAISTSSASGVIVGATLQGLLSTLFSITLGVVLAPLSVLTYADLRARYEPFSTAHLFAPPAGTPPVS